MPKIKIAAGGDFTGVDAAKGFDTYDGPLPPKGVYRLRVKFWKLVESSNGDPMFKIGIEVDEPKGSDKAKYNGAFTMDYRVLMEKTAPFVNAMLDALGLSRKAVWVDGIVTSRDDEEKVLKIGGKVVHGLLFKARLKHEPYEGEMRIKIGEYLGLASDDAPSDDDDDDDDDDESAAAPSSTVDDSGDDDSSSDDDDDEDSF